MSKSQQLKNICHFLSNYEMKHTDKNTIVLQSPESFYLSKTFEIEDNYERIQCIKDELQLHLGFSFKGFLGLLHYQFSKHQKNGMKLVRTVYEYERCTLEQQILQRQPNDYFSQNELWRLLQTVASILQYLQSQNTAYGVLSLNKICYNEGQFYLIDPSAYQNNRSFEQNLTFSSPELKQQWNDDQQTINYFNSDVYALGVCMLLAACLKTEQYQFDDLIIQIKQRYSEDLVHVLKYMLKENPDQRPSYNNIREFIQTQLYQNQESLQLVPAEELTYDSEDIPNDIGGCSCTEIQIVDIQEPSNDIFDEISEFDQAKLRIMKISQLSKECLNQSPIEFQEQDHKSSYFNEQFVKNSLYDTTSFLETSTTLKGISKIKRIKNERLTNVKATSSITFEEEPLWSKRSSTIFTDPDFIQSLRNNKMNFKKQEKKGQDKQNRMMNY